MHFFTSKPGKLRASICTFCTSTASKVCEDLVAPHTDTRMSKHKPQPDTLSAMPHTPHSALLLPAPPAATKGHTAGRYTLQSTCFTGTKVPVCLLYWYKSTNTGATGVAGWSVPCGRLAACRLLYWYKSTCVTGTKVPGWSVRFRLLLKLAASLPCSRLAASVFVLSSQ